ncbi:MAG: hypothetical protein ABW104_07005 [Candidatus Thiodiazotropha sp. 6PLUC2]
MPKKGKKTKKSDSGAKRKLSKKFVKMHKHQHLTGRVELLEKQVAELQRLLSAGGDEKVESDDIESVELSDDLKKIKGIGAVLEKKLHGIGINSFKQIADWNQADIDRFSDQLSFKGRIEREDWVAQAKELVAK